MSLPAATRRRIRRAALAATPTTRSLQVRHAVRAASAVLLALVIARWLNPGDPFVTTLLVTTFGTVQAGVEDTLRRARQRVLGCALGAGTLVVALSLVRPADLLPIAVLVLGLGFWFVRANPLIANAAFMFVSVGVNSSVRVLEPGAALLEYAGLVTLAVVIGVVFGFVLPAGPRRRDELLDAATRSTADQLRAVARFTSCRAAASDTRAIDGSLVDAVRRTREACAARADLAAAPRSDDDGAMLADVRDALAALTACSLLLALCEPESPATPWHDAADALLAETVPPSGSTRSRDAGTGISTDLDLVVLALQARAALSSARRAPSDRGPARRRRAR